MRMMRLIYWPNYMLTNRASLSLARLNVLSAIPLSFASRAKSFEDIAPSFSARSTKSMASPSVESSSTGFFGSSRSAAVALDSPVQTKPFSGFSVKPCVIPFCAKDASLMISQGIDVATVGKRLGHTTPATTMKIYAHALQRPDQGAADKLDE